MNNSENKLPVVSIVMPVYNAGSFLRDSINSIVNQTFTQWELLIVDDNSKDNSVSVINSYTDPRIKCFFNTENKGPAYSRNLAIEHSNGEYIAIMDADDIAMPKRIEIEYSFLENHPNVDVVGASSVKIDEENNVIERNFVGGSISSEQIFVNTLFACPLLHSSVMIRKKFWLNNGLFYDNSYPCNQDYELWSRVIFFGNIFVLPDCLIKYRISPNQISTRNRTFQLELANKLRKQMFLRLSLDFTMDELETFNQIEEGVVSNIYLVESVLKKLATIKDSKCNHLLLMKKILKTERKILERQNWLCRIKMFMRFQYDTRHFSMKDTLLLLMPLSVFYCFRRLYIAFNNHI